MNEEEFSAYYNARLDAAIEAAWLELLAGAPTLVTVGELVFKTAKQALSFGFASGVQWEAKRAKEERI